MNLQPRNSLVLVEDERVVAFDLKRQLQALGYEVPAVVARGEDAVARVADLKPDLVLMDIHLEGPMDGIEAAGIIRARQPVPVVFLTAYAEDDMLRRATETCPYGYLVKPCETRELHATIQMALARRASEDAVEQSEARLKLALDAASIGVLEWFQGADRLSGEGHMGPLGSWPAPISRTWDEFLSHVAPDDRQRVNETMQNIQCDGQVRTFLFQANGDGSEKRWMETRLRSYPALSKAEPPRVVGIVQDVTEQRRIEEYLRNSSVVFETTSEAIYITDADRRIVAVNGAFGRITGYREQEALGADPDVLLGTQRESHNFFPLLELVRSGEWQGRISCRRKDGDGFPAWQSLNTVRDASGRVTHYVSAFSDITALCQAEQQLNYLAHHDQLTGLPNRWLFEDRLTQAIERARRYRCSCCLLFLDLDGFKVVNDTLGHSAGDHLLQQVAERLQSILRRSDTVARVGGDEFVVIVFDPAQIQDAVLLAEKMLATLAQPFTIAGESITVSGSIGIALFPDHGMERHSLLRSADIAMYSAKAKGRNRYQIYSGEMATLATDRMNLEQGLRRALLGNSLILHYQPQVSLADHRTVGAEALVRWPHPELGMIPPGRFIPVAEESGVVEELGCWVLAHACREALQLTQFCGHPLRLSVNISARQFIREGFVASVRDILAQTGFPADMLELEITESTLQVIEHSRGILGALKELGVAIAIDDFGTGYSSLSVLQGLPVDRLKIDRSFILGIPQNPRSLAIVESICGLARALDLAIVVEGIESPEQADALRRLGCQEGQGYYFGKPAPIEALLPLLGGTRH